ncbi:testicular acid phosphatase homolog isoform X2 [Phymastichus coffea]|uniref:testicular acid phosphatase homolog isoform X2 n=1 Tax=Phymastichus coffea TaxID=108790 RepID=UPI00273C964D|nr:testicular acid phosphatase homolog isoform X2 [Phymastichus coffea]
MASVDELRLELVQVLVLAGLYPPTQHQSWHPELNWHPIPTHYLPKELDILLQTFHNPKYQQILREVRSSSAFEDRTRELIRTNNRYLVKHKIETINKHGFLGLMGIFNVLNTHRAAKAPLPHWYTEELYSTLKEQVISYFDGMSLTTEMMKLSTGPLIKTVLENMSLSDASKQNPRKIYLYSGHELNIAAFTRAHDIKEFRYPDFANALVIEKFRDSDNRIYVRMLYQTGRDSDFQPITLGSHAEYCPMDEYSKVIEKVLPSDEEVNALFENSQQLSPQIRFLLAAPFALSGHLLAHLVQLPCQARCFAQKLLFAGASRRFGRDLALQHLEASLGGQRRSGSFNELFQPLTARSFDDYQTEQSNSVARKSPTCPV